MVSRNLRFHFTLVSYNILSQSLLNEHSYLYTHCSPKDLEWPRRGHRIVSELLHDQADIICLQEVESEHLKTLFQPKLERCGYECVYKKKTGYKLDGCAIFYKSKLFQLHKCKGIEFNRTDVAYLLNRDNVGIIAVLKPKIETRSKSSHLVIANTHLLFNPRRSDIKMAQLKFFLSELEEISLKSTSHSQDDLQSARHHPTILCGDLNSRPNSDVSRYILRNNPDYQWDSSNNTSSQQTSPSITDPPSNMPNMHREHCNSPIGGKEGEGRPSGGGGGSEVSNLVESACRPRDRIDSGVANSDSPVNEQQPDETDCLVDFSHSLLFESVYPALDKRGNAYVSTFSSCIVDHIYYTPKLLHLDSYKELLTADQLRQIGSLPNEEFPSDHLTLGAKFTIR